MSQPNRPIRVALIGLNAPYNNTSNPATGTSWAAAAHLPYLTWSPKYEIVALQNSSVEKAVISRNIYGLDESKVKVYGRAEDVANDPDVDLVVTSIRVDKHANSVIPSIQAGKDVFVEWPLEANPLKAGELTDLVKRYGVRNIVGLQGGKSPVVKKMKELIEQGAIGRVEASNVVAKAYGGSTMASHVDYFVDKEVGGNILTIAFGHALECILEALGDIKTYSSLLVNQYPEVDIIDSSTGDIKEKGRKNTVPNQIVFDGILSSGAVLTLKMHGGTQVSTNLSARGSGSQTSGNGSPMLDWRIFGSKGEIRVIGHSTWSLNTGSKDFRVELWSAESGQTALIDVGEDELAALPVPARNIGRLYEAFAAGEGYPDFEKALKRHDLIENMYRQNKM